MIAFSPEKLRAARAEKGWTQLQLAQALSIAERNVQRWEAGRNEPRAATLAAVAAALDRPIEFFYANGSTKA